MTDSLIITIAYSSNFINSIFWHIRSNIYQFLQYSDFWNFIIYFLFQTVHGFVHGFLYCKTRSIYPSIIVHYLTNWMGPI
ncbi:MAG: CPBP family intramembrane glutamic endopeptidase [Promethearchaeota archaeon]